MSGSYLERIQAKLARQGQRYSLEQLEEMSVYEPHGAARELFRTRAKEVLIEGPAGTGKSRALLEKLHRCCQKYPRIRCLILRQTKESIPETVLPIFEEYVLGPSSRIKEGPNTHNRQFYLYPNKSRIVVGGLDKPIKIMSSQYDLIAIFEGTEVALNAYEYLLTRLRNYKMPYQQMLVDCNPDSPFHWLNRRPEQPHAKYPDQPQMLRLRSKHEDNPFLFDHEKGDWTKEGREYLENLDGLTGARRLRLRHGKWAAAEGAVYEEVWDPAIHIVKPPDLRNMRRIFASLDWGFTNPGVMLVWGLDYDDRMYCLAQVYQRGKTNSWWIDQAKAMQKRFAGLDAFIADPAEPKSIEDFRRAGLRVIEANNDITTGIKHVTDRLVVAGDGLPRLMYVENCLVERDVLLEEDSKPSSTEQEYTVYAWPKALDGKPVKEKPVDIDNHGMDATRYGVMYADGIGRFEARIERTGLRKKGDRTIPPWERLGRRR